MIPRKRKHRCSPACERISRSIRHLGGTRHQVVRLRYVKEFDDSKQRRVAKVLDRLGAALYELWSIGVEARVGYEGKIDG